MVFIFYLFGAKNRCIPFKFEKIVDGHTRNPHSRLLVLMISSPNRDDLVFPKVSVFLLAIVLDSKLGKKWDVLDLNLISSFEWQGGWENDETVEEAARREALEEAGVRGILGVCSKSWLNTSTKAIILSHSQI